jgi:Ferritin-like
MSDTYRVNHYGISFPKPDHGEDGPIQTVESLKEHLQAALTVELSTIPLYLYGMYSVNNAPDVSSAVHGASDYF